MNQETTFRLVLGVGFVAVLGVTLYHRVQSWASKETLDRRQEGLFMLATLRPVGLLLWLGVIAYLINPASMDWSSMELPVWLRWTGLVPFGVGLGLLTWALRCLGTNLTDTVVTRRSHTLVTHGPYRWVRHPFYDAMALFILAIVLLAGNGFLLVTGAIVCVLLPLRTGTEEAHLLARFGAPYRDYQRRTGRFLPKLFVVALLGLPMALGGRVGASAPEVRQSTLFGVALSEFVFETAPFASATSWRDSTPGHRSPTGRWSRQRIWNRA